MPENAESFLGVEPNEPLVATAKPADPPLSPQWAAEVESRLQAVEHRIRMLPQTNIIHPQFWTRAWAVYGHALVPGLIIGAVFWVFALMIALSAR